MISESMLLKKHGYRLTPVRSFIIEFLATHKKPFDVITIQANLAKALRKVNKTTVYREIDFLLSQELIKEVNFGDGKKRYEIASLPHHHHLMCIDCNKIEDVILEDELKPIEKKITKTSKFKIKKHTLEFFGLCAQCASN
jgi:Fe2+ or Zn2+ uptake regulation protein